MLARKLLAISFVALFASANCAKADKPDGLPAFLNEAYDEIARIDKSVKGGLEGMKGLAADLKLLAQLEDSKPFKFKVQTLKADANDLPPKDKGPKLDRNYYQPEKEPTDEARIYVALWLEWRHYKRIKGADDIVAAFNSKGIGILSGVVDKFVKVRFTSSPTSAEVAIDGLPRGTTVRDVYLSVDSEYKLVVSKTGYEDWEKKDYKPPARGEKLEAELKKKDK